MPEHGRASVPLADIICDATLGTTARSLDGSGDLTLIKMGSIRDGKIDSGQTESLNSADVRGLERIRLRPGDILLNTRNTPPLVGKVGVWRSTDTSSVPDNNLIILRVADGNHPSYINAQLSFGAPAAKIKSLAVGTTSVAAIYWRDVKKVHIPILPFPEQCRIAEILDAVDEDIELTKSYVRKYAMSAESVENSLLNSVISEARTVELQAVASVSSGVTLGSEPDVDVAVELPYLRVANVQDGFIDTAEMKMVAVRHSDIGRYLLQDGDILLTEGGDLDKLGRGAVWDARISPCLHQNHIFKVRCNRDVVLPEFLAAYISSPKGKRYFLQVAKQTTNLASINSTQVKAMPVPIIDLDEQKRLVRLIDQRRSDLTVAAASLGKLKALKQALTNDLLTGRVRVPLHEE
jgi:type I restriction enzyme S subunit